MLPVDADAWLAWRPVPVPEAPRDLPLDTAGMREGENLAAGLDVAFPSEVVSIALEVALHPELRSWWGAVAKRLKEVELNAMDAVLVLHCMVRLGCCDRQLLSKAVDQIECRYFSMELGLPERHRAMELFPPKEGDDTLDSFQALVDRLPVDHKVKIVIMDNVGREQGRLRERPLPPEPDAKKKWRTFDPIELEDWEKRQFEKGRIWIKRIRCSEAQVSRMRPGNKLSATLALQLLQVLPTAPPATLAELAQICAFFPRVRPLHGDLFEDFREMLARRVTALDPQQVRPYALAFASGMRDFGGSEACRAWRKMLVPEVLQVLRTSQELGLEVFERQLGFHSHLRGVPHIAAEVVLPPQEAEAGASSRNATDAKDVDTPQAEAGTSSHGALEANRCRAERAAALFVAVATARQVDLDCQLFDRLAAPLKASLRQHLRSPAAAEAPTQLLPLETLADVLDACASCGVDDNEAKLPRLLLQLFERQFGEDIREHRFKLSSYAMTDLSTMAHAASVLCAKTGAEGPLELLWIAAESKLRTSEPHLVLMLLDALVRGGSEELLTLPAVVAAVDEYLVQRLDLDPSRLGRLGL